jgi:hypothetical protein
MWVNALQLPHVPNTSETVKHSHHLESTNRPPFIVKHLILGRFLLLSGLNGMLFQGFGYHSGKS